MTRNVDVIVGQVLSHYADPNYDPAARRERYLRTRQLKGRPTASAATPTTKSRTAKAAPKTRKKSAKQTQAEKRAEAIREKIKERLERRMDTVDFKVSQEIEKLPKIPKYVSADTRARLTKARQQKVAQIMEKAGVQKGDLREGATKELARELKAAVSKARSKANGKSDRKTVANDRRR